MRLRPFALCALLLLLAAMPPVTSASQTQTWSSDAETLALGERTGVAISQRGKLFAAPELIRVDEADGSLEPGQVWSMVVDASGTLFLGTGPDGAVVKVGPSGRRTLHYRVEEPMVTALALTAEGDLLAGTAPGGRIYRIRSDGRGELFSETGERYIWSLAVDGRGKIFAGTGERGTILEIGVTGTASPFFDSAEMHVTSLLPGAQGGLVAGGASRGLVYQINRDGNGLVLHDDDLVEVAALLPRSDGSMIAALIAPPSRVSQKPAVQLKLPDGVQVGVTTESVGSLEESSGRTIRGVIEGLDAGEIEGPRSIRGRLVRIDADGRVEELWRSTDEAPFTIVDDGRGNVLFGTGEPARLYRIDAQGDVALLATLKEGQLTRMVRRNRSVFLATSNPAATYRLGTGAETQGLFISAPIDAGGPARWGTVSWAPESGPGLELYTRTGNSRDPDDTWSGWSPRLARPEGSPVDNPDGRFLQWRARFVGAQSEGSGVGSVRVSYEAYNRSPMIRDFRLQNEAVAVRDVAEFRWSTSDPDGDRVVVGVEYRSSGATEWSEAGLAGPTEAPPPVIDATAWHPSKSDWDVSELEEGSYEVRARVSDQASNPRGQGKIGAARKQLLLIVDRSAPSLDIGPVLDGAVSVRASDRHAPLARLELLEANEVRFTARPVDGICDTSDETFRVELPPGGPWSVRAVDAAGNRAEAPLPAP